MTRPGFIDRLLDLLFPQRCPWCNKVMGYRHACELQQAVSGLLLPDGPLPAPKLDEPWLSLGHWACFHYEEPVRSTILRMKFEDERNLAVPIGEVMAKRFRSENLGGLCDILVPVPMSPNSERKRGYNQSALLAWELTRHVGTPCFQNALLKTRETTAQSELNREGRLTNVTGAYRADSEDVAGKRVLLVDDIVTTGSTLNECAKALLAAGASECRALSIAVASGELLT